jgi:hypothetical protein
MGKHPNLRLEMEIRGFYERANLSNEIEGQRTKKSSALKRFNRLIKETNLKMLDDTKS